MDYVKFYRDVYKEFSRLTPVDFDCGRLCRSRCCRGDNDAGMILFPHERELLETVDFLQIRTIPVYGIQTDCAFCRGKCVRALRPLSCRIYPFAPLLSDDGVNVEPDPRAYSSCILLRPEATAKINPMFIGKIKELFTMFIEIPEMLEFMTFYTAMLEDYSRFF